MIKEYVVVDAYSASDEVLLIHKNNPDYLSGLYNLVGGKLEDGESPLLAAVRELKEESGLDAISVVYCGKVLGESSIIHYLQASVSESQLLRPGEDETEPVEWHDYHEALDNPLLMPNLKLVLPLLRSGAKGWKVLADRSWRGERHKLSLIMADSPPIEVTVKGLDNE